MFDLSTKISNRLSLSDPFMIASSHWTENEAAFKHLSGVVPSAVTLKTTSAREGGTGRTGLRRREKTKIFGTFGAQIGAHTDGPKTLELWDIPTTIKLSQIAYKTFSRETKLGLSVLSEEDYGEIKSLLDMRIYSYVELNWKYTFRSLDPADVPARIEAVYTDFRNFLEVFQDLPCILKVSAEACGLLASNVFLPIREAVRAAEGALLVANTQRIRVPPSRLRGSKPLPLETGVVYGEYLLLQTFNTLRELGELRSKGEAVPSVIATGGIVDVGAVVDVLAAGAEAVQLCSALDLRGIETIEWLREQLSHVGERFQNLEDLKLRVETSPIEWSRAAEQAVALGVNEETLFDALFKNTAPVETILQEAIQAELSGVSATAPLDTDESVPTPPAAPQNLRFVIPKSNIGSYLLAQAVVRRGGLTPLEVDDAYAFRQRLRDPGFEWDFIILPKCVVSALAREGRGVFGHDFFDIGPRVGTSVSELVGKRGPGDEKIDCIFHFDGAMSNEALIRWKAELEPATMPDLEVIEGDRILPVLRFWRSTYSILAKRPLSRVYALLCPPEVRDNWGTFWHTTEDLVLVTSRTFRSRPDSGLILSWLTLTLDIVRKGILGNSPRVARELVTGGFLGHCAKLLGAKRVP